MNQRIGASALAFGWMHLVYGNLVAIGLTLAGGWYFADTYAKTGSLRLATLEHALYGNLLFTIGLGGFFSHSEVPPFEQAGLISALPWQRIIERAAGWF